MNFQIPPALKTEHEELHAKLARVTKAGGRTGEAAMDVAKVMMRPHSSKRKNTSASIWGNSASSLSVILGTSAMPLSAS